MERSDLGLLPDYVVVGGGTAGCVLAARLSEDPAVKVVLLEAGGEPKSPWLHIPIGFGRTRLNPKFDWRYEAEGFDPAGPKPLWPRGKVLGGSGAINGLMYVRGQAEDYDHWRQLGNVGWSSEEVMATFMRCEDRLDRPSPARGSGGPVAVSDGRYDSKLARLYVEAAQKAGLPFNDDYNAGVQEGVSWTQYSTRNGRRAATAYSYLGPARGRTNLTIITGAHVERIEIVDGRASAILFHDATGPRRVRAGREIVLSTGAIASPHILQLSGIGPGEWLQAAGVPVVHDAPGVGRNLQDHFHVRLIYTLNKPISLNDQFASPLGRMWAGLDYALRRRGPLAMGAAPAHVFAKVGSKAASPDMQILCFPYTADATGRNLQRRSVMAIAACSLRPESRGTIMLKSPDPMVRPIIQPNYLSTQYDCDTIVAGVRLARAIATARPLSDVVEAEEQPGAGAASDDEILAYSRQIGGTSYHVVGTCKMGIDPMAVCDPRLRVIGVRGLRVADASIMPTVTSGNTNAPTIMIAERAAAMIREDRA